MRKTYKDQTTMTHYNKTKKQEATKGFSGATLSAVPFIDLELRLEERIVPVAGGFVTSDSTSSLQVICSLGAQM